MVVGTPIGNLGDLSPRAAQALSEADVVACEDTRRTATLLRHVGARAPMIALHAHNEASRVGDLVARMKGGERVALVTDAGMPVVSDPGVRLVRAAAEAGVPVDVVPGPSAVTAALALSGLGEGAGFTFLGFLPRRPAERAALMDRLAGTTEPVVAFESPQRLRASLEALAAVFPQRPVAVCRELTKLHQEVLRGTAAEVAAAVTETPRGEITLVIGPDPVPPPGDAAGLADGLALLLDAGLGAGRAAEVAAAFGAAPRNRAYKAALALIEERRSAR